MRRLAAAVLAVLVLAGCTDIPASSDTQRIESIPAGNEAVAPTIIPSKGTSPRQIVNLFLQLNSATDANHAAARKFLTRPASTAWKDTTVTVLGTDESVGNFVPGPKKTEGVVNVRGGVIGKLDTQGVYTPTRKGTGTGGPPETFAFTVVAVRGDEDEWRIKQLPPGLGLLLNIDRYDSAYQSYPLYFFDQARHYLVPDLRASALENEALQAWLLRQLAMGPRKSLLDTVDRDTFPSQVNPANASGAVSITRGTPLRIEIAGAAGLGGARLSRLAAQIAYTLDRASNRPGTFSITAGGQPQSVPGVGTQFFADQFTSARRTPPSADVYYLRDGRVTTEEGRTVAGAIATGHKLSTFAIGRRRGEMVIAGAASDVPGSPLYLGTPSAGLTAVKQVTGLTARPAWAPGLNEVWAASGHLLYRISLGVTEAAPTVAVVDIPSVAADSQIVALRLSPDGARIALVVLGADQSRRLYVAAVVRTPGRAVRVTTLEPISPDDVRVYDVSWIDATRLYAIGVLSGSLESKFFEENVDGSDWSPPRGIDNLPGAPNYVTIVAGNPPWVSSNQSVFEQDGTGAASWTSPGPGTNTPGDAPVYLE